jgi:D-sedoheptulose 7-phosphate isomerase
MRSAIYKSVQDSILALIQLQEPESLAFIEQAGTILAEAFENGNKVLAAGNGGSLCDAMHLAEEFTGIYRHRRRALPAIALSDPGHLSCIGNDLGFDWVFARGVEAFGRPGDVFIGLTTSGNSPNIIHAFKKARDLGLKTIALLGRGGGALSGFADLELCIDGFSTSDRIQEAHMAALHIIIEIVEYKLFPELTSLSLASLIKT